MSSLSFGVLLVFEENSEGGGENESGTLRLGSRRFWVFPSACCPPRPPPAPPRLLHCRKILPLMRHSTANPKP